MNGAGGTAGAGWGGVGAGERPKFLGINEMQKALREAGTQLRETHERNERQLQVVSYTPGSPVCSDLRVCACDARVGAVDGQRGLD